MHEIEVRCPVGPQRLFFKMKAIGETPKITSDNLIEVACADCRKALAREGHKVGRVIHCYNILGELVNSYTED